MRKPTSCMADMVDLDVIHMQINTLFTNKLGNHNKLEKTNTNKHNTVFLYQKYTPKQPDYSTHMATGAVCRKLGKTWSVDVCS